MSGNCGVLKTDKERLAESGDNVGNRITQTRAQTLVQPFTRCET